MRGVIKINSDKSMCSNAHIILNNKSKLKIIDNSNSHNNQLKNDYSDDPNKDETVTFLT